jgi:hypothetical protein
MRVLCTHCFIWDYCRDVHAQTQALAALVLLWSCQVLLHRVFSSVHLPLCVSSGKRRNSGRLLADLAF